MELPDCPPGAEGYEDTVLQVPKKTDDSNDAGCTKAEREFQEHLGSLKIKLEDGTFRCMVERRGRDISGKWIYLCYPCAAVCSGESILQTHISGKKHKSKLATSSPWPLSIFEQHPYILSEKGNNTQTGATDVVLQKMAAEVDLHNKNASDLDSKYDKYRNVRCHIQDSIDAVKAPLLGLEYLIEHPPVEVHYEPTYICVLCTKHGHPRTIINHLTSFWHKYAYLSHHFKSAMDVLSPYRTQSKYREGVSMIMNRISQRIEDTYGRMRPVNIDKDEYEKDKDVIHQWIYKSYHISEKSGRTFEEVADIDLINTISKTSDNTKSADMRASKKKDPSPPVVAAPTKPRGVKRAASVGSLSDISLDEPVDGHSTRDQRSQRSKHEPRSKPHFEVNVERGRQDHYRSKYAAKNAPEDKEKVRAPNYKYKVKMANDVREKIEDSAKAMLAYHEKNPEKHPLYPDEWKKFWNRRYKELQADGKDPSKHDFKPEWIVFWTARMKELHDKEMKVQVHELYRRMCLTPPDNRRPDEMNLERNKTESESSRRRSPEPRRRSPHGPRRSPNHRPRVPDQRRRSPGGRRRSPEPRARSPGPRRRSPEPRRRSPIPRRRTPDHVRERSPGYGRAAPHWSVNRVRSPNPYRPRSRSPERRRSPARARPPAEGAGRERSPLAQRVERDAALPFRNRSPNPAPHASHAPHAQRDQREHREPSLQTVMVSDDELKPDDGLSPWNSDNESLSSLPSARSSARPRSRSRTASEATTGRGRGRPAPAAAHDLGPPENVVATLRLLVALEDYLGSLGPRIVDMLTEALTMEKEKANSSEELLDREPAVVLMETAKEKLKGAAQAGLVGETAAAAVRAAVVRVAATLHAADQRAKKRHQQKPPESKPTALPVAGVGEVDRAQIAQQMAAALIAQGKTDVSSEELAQLVDAVVGMAEAKKREAAEKKAVIIKPTEKIVERPKPQPVASSRILPAVASGTASALQMLQSAYDENEKKVEKEEATDAMDGLSDSDLETLLKNFNELSAEEQHSLIAYLKKLEAKSPQRVERLRQYVSSAAAIGDEKVEEADAASDIVAVADTVAILSDDDDDYTVEEVFKSATLKVQENQMRQEMEIVKKSLEELKPAPVQDAPKRDAVPTVNLTKHLSSATDLLALVQASVQSTATVTDVATDVVSSGSQPRSFGDRPESEGALEQKSHTNPQQDLPQSMARPFANQQSSLRQTPTNVLNSGNKNMDTDPPKNDSWNARPTQDNRPMAQDNRPPMQQSLMNNRGPPIQGNRGPPIQGNRGPLIQDNQGPLMQDNWGNSMQGNQGPPIQDNWDNSMQDNQNTPLLDNWGNPMPHTQSATMQDNWGNPMQGNQSASMQDNWGNTMQDNQSASMQDNWGNPMQDNQSASMQDNWGNTMQNNQGPPMQDKWSNSMQDNQGPPMRNNWGNADNRGPPRQDNIPMPNRPLIQDNRGPMRGPRFPNQPGNYGPDPAYNQGPRGMFVNTRMQNNFDNRSMDNNYNPQSNFRGRGGVRGQYGGGRGRGRGNY